MKSACAPSSKLPARRPSIRAGLALAAIAAAGMVYVLVTILLKSELLIWLHAHLPAKLQILRGYFPVPGEDPRK